MVPFDERPNTTAGKLSCLRLKVVECKNGRDRNWVVVNCKNKAEEPSTNEAVPITSKEQDLNNRDSGKACSMHDEENHVSEGTSGSVSPNGFSHEFPSSSSKKVSHKKHRKTGKKNEELPSTLHEVQDISTNHKDQAMSESCNPSIPSSSTENIPQRKHKKKRKHSSAPSSPDVQDEAINHEVKAIPEEVTNSIPTSSTEKSYFRKHKKNKHGKSCLSPNMQGDTSKLEELSLAEDVLHSISSSTTERLPDQNKGKRKSRSTPSSPNIHKELKYKDLVASTKNALINIASSSTANNDDENDWKGKFTKKGQNNSAPATPNAHHIAFSNFSGHIDITQNNLENSQFSGNVQDKSDDKNCIVSEDVLHGISNSATNIPLEQIEDKQEKIRSPTDLSTPNLHDDESCKQEEFVPESLSTNSLALSAAISTIEDDLINSSSGTLPHADGVCMVSKMSRKRKRSIDEELKLSENSEQSYPYSVSNITSSAYLSTNVTKSDILEVNQAVCSEHTTVNSSDAVESVLSFNSSTSEANLLINSSLLTTEALDNEQTFGTVEKSLPSPKSTQMNSSEPGPCTVKFSATSEIIGKLPQSSKVADVLTSPKPSITEHSVDKSSVPVNTKPESFLSDGPESNYSASESLKIASFDSSGTLPVSAESQIDDLPNLPDLDTSVAVPPHTTSPNLPELDTAVAVTPHTASPNLPELDTSAAVAPHTASPNLPELDTSVAVAPLAASPNLPHLETSVAVAPHTASPNSYRCSIQDKLPQVTLPIASVAVSINTFNSGGLQTALFVDQLQFLLPRSPEDPSATKFLLPISNLRIDQNSTDAIVEKLVIKNILRKNVHGVDKSIQAEPETEYILPDIPPTDICTPTDSSTISLKKSINENNTTVESTLVNRSVIQYAKSSLHGNLSTRSDLHENKLKTDPKNEISVNMDEGVKITENTAGSPSEKEISVIEKLKNENLAGASTNPSDENVAIIVEDILGKLESKLTGSQDFNINECNDPLIKKMASTTDNVSTERMDYFQRIEQMEDFTRIEGMDVDSDSDTSSDSSENEDMEISDKEDIAAERSLETERNLIKPKVKQSELSKCENSAVSVFSKLSVSNEIRPYPVKLVCANPFDTVSRINELSNSPQTDAVLREMDFLMAQLELRRSVDASCETEDQYFDLIAKVAQNPNYLIEETERLRKVRWGYWIFPKSCVLNVSDNQSMPQQDEINNSEVTESSSVPPVNTSMTNSNITNSISRPSTDIEMNNLDPTPSTSFSSANVEEDTESNNVTIRLEVTQSAPTRSLFSRPDVTGRNLFFPLPSERPTVENIPAEVPTVENQTTMCYLAPECPNYKIIAKLQELYAFFKMGKDVFRIHAYEKAIFALGKHPKLIESVEEAQTINGIGRKISFKVWEIARTGELKEIKVFCHKRWIEAKKMFSRGWGITPFMARKLYKEEFCSVAEALSDAKFLNRSQRLALQYYNDLSKTMTRVEAEAIADIVIGLFKERNEKLTVEACSTLRRNKKVCGHVSVLVILEMGVVNDRPLLDDVVAAMHIQGYIIDDLMRHEENGNQSRYSGVFQVNKMARYRRLDICVAPYMERVCAKFFLTGPSYFLRAMVRHAEKKEMVLDEHGIRYRVLNMFGGTDYVTHLCVTDEISLFKYVDVPYRPPEDRDFIPLCTFLNA